jgi:ABC-type nitrate/sulfonate/bicarbonate transport system substrate-binding protein
MRNNSNRVFARGRIPAAVAASAALAAGAIGTSPAVAQTTAHASAGTPITFGFISTTPNLTGPLGFADKHGLLQKWLKPYGVSAIKTANFANGPLLTAALEGGSVDVGTLGDTPALIAHGTGVKTRLIAQDELGQGAYILGNASISSIADLKGQTIAVQPESYMDRYMQQILLNNGILDNVTRSGQLLSASIPAFNSGQLPAIVILHTQLSEITLSGYHVLANSTTTPQYEGTSVIEATDGAVQKNPKLEPGIQAARVKAIAYAKQHASAYYAYQATAEGTTPALAKANYSLSDYPTQAFTTAGVAQLTNTLTFIEKDLLTGPPAVKITPFTIASWEKG